MKQSYVLISLISFLVITLAMGCKKEDDKPEPQVIEEPVLEVWELEVEQVIAATAEYIDFQKALDDGLIDVSGYVPNMGHHYLNPAYADGIFELEKPEIILYVPDDNGDMQMVAVEYSIIPADPDNPGSPPEGFTGDLDEWHYNEMIGQWQLHVWTIWENPLGIFETFNFSLGD
jgi:hypothetical protein